ncbi:hypothetical protein KC644_04425 [Candidatus Berkelbacteria bacterium]|nr:hypothetical protein [Candidatus Berkelbacteria bacterium]
MSKSETELSYLYTETNLERPESELSRTKVLNVWQIEDGQLKKVLTDFGVNNDDRIGDLKYVDADRRLYMATSGGILRYDLNNNTEAYLISGEMHQDNLVLNQQRTKLATIVDQEPFSVTTGKVVVLDLVDGSSQEIPLADLDFPEDSSAPASIGSVGELLYPVAFSEDSSELIIEGLVGTEASLPEYTLDLATQTVSISTPYGVRRYDSDEFSVAFSSLGSDQCSLSGQDSAKIIVSRNQTETATYSKGATNLGVVTFSPDDNHLLLRSTPAITEKTDQKQCSDLVVSYLDFDLSTQNAATVKDVAVLYKSWLPVLAPFEFTELTGEMGKTSNGKNWQVKNFEESLIEFGAPVILLTPNYKLDLELIYKAAN